MAFKAKDESLTCCRLWRMLGMLALKTRLKLLRADLSKRAILDRIDCFEEYIFHSSAKKWSFQRILLDFARCEF